MARRVFFSFHYERDIIRASQIRNSWVTQGRESAGFLDASDWEEVKRGGDAAIKRWIDDQMIGTSVTVVLIGTETSKRNYVTYEIKQSCVLKKGLLGVRIHLLKDFNRNVDVAGDNPFDDLYYEREGPKQLLSELYPTYDYMIEDGYSNMDDWIEKAALAAGR